MFWSKSSWWYFLIVVPAICIPDHQGEITVIRIFLRGLVVIRDFRLFMFHCINQKIFIALNYRVIWVILHFSWSQMLPVFLHLFFFSLSSSQTLWSVYDCNCLYNPTCPLCLPPTGLALLPHSLLSKRKWCMSPLVDPWPDAADHLSLCSSQNNMYYSSLITVDQLELTRSDKSENITQFPLLPLQLV